MRKSVSVSDRPMIAFEAPPTVLSLPLAPEVDLMAPDRIVLWKGRAELAVPGSDFTGDAALTRTWVPRPTLELRVSTDESWRHGTAQLTPDDVRIDGKALRDGWMVTHMTGPMQPVERTIDVPEITFGDLDVGVSAVRFAVANFPSFTGLPVTDGRTTRASRIELDSLRWHFRLDEIGPIDLDEQMRSSGRSHATTHAGLMTLRDGATTSHTDAVEAVRGFCSWASILRGAYTSAVTMVGEDGAGRSIWVHHMNWVLDPWNSPAGPLPKRLPLLANSRTIPVPALERSLERVFGLDADPDWHEVLNRVSLWYLTANLGQTDGDLILAQAGLELLAYASVVFGGRRSAKEFLRLTPAQQLELLLDTLGLSRDVPAEWESLRRFSNGHHLDAPAVVVAFRNRLVHPPEKRSRGTELDDGGARFEAKMLALHLLERALLVTLCYDGAVRDRPSRTTIVLS